MARPSKHDGVVYKRKDSSIWWMRYRDKTGRRRMESTNTDRLERGAAEDARAPCSPETTTPLTLFAGQANHV